MVSFLCCIDVICGCYDNESPIDQASARRIMVKLFPNKLGQSLPLYSATGGTSRGQDGWFAVAIIGSISVYIDDVYLLHRCCLTLMKYRDVFH